MDAGFLDGPHIEVIGIDEAHDDDAEEIIVAQAGRADLWQAAHDGLQLVGGALHRVTGAEQLDHVLVQAFVLFVHNGVARIVQQVLRIQIAGQRDHFAIDFQRVSHGQRIRIAGHRNDVGCGENTRLLQDLLPHLGERNTVLRRIELLGTAGNLGRLEGDAAHTGLLQPVADDLADLVVVQSFLQGNHQGGGEVLPVQVFQCLPAYGPQVFAAQGFEGFFFKRVELQIHLKIRHVRCQAAHEGRIFGNADAVGVQHQVPDGLALGNVQNFKELRVHGGFAAADLHHVGLAFIGHHNVEHPFYFFQGTVAPVVRAALRVAGRAGQVAAVGHFHDGQAGVLLMVGAEAAVVGATEVGVGIEYPRHLAALDKVARIAVILDVRSDQYLLPAMFGTAFKHKHLVVFKNHLRIHAAQAAGAKGEGKIIVNIRAIHRAVIGYRLSGY